MINLTAAAIQEIRRLMASKGLDVAMIRFGVETGGCSGLQYSLDFAHESDPSDHVFEHDGLTVVCDAESWDYLEGLQVDFSSQLVGGGFKFINPNAIKSCGCGTSFRI